MNSPSCQQSLVEISLKIPPSVTLIAVVKGQPVEKIREALAAGQVDFGENYAQELLVHRSWLVARGKYYELPATSYEPQAIRWHFIGHLQRNKVKAILPHVTLIHTVDSLPLAQEIDKHAGKLARIQEVLVEVNLGEKSKSGVHKDQVETLVAALNPLSHLSLRGLMTIPPFLPDPETIRPYFRQLREIRDAINKKNVYKRPLAELSMGMTHDFQVAIDEGATMVRIGSGIFGQRL